MARYILHTDTPSTVLKVNKIVFCLFFSEPQLIQLQSYRKAVDTEL